MNSYIINVFQLSGVMLLGLQLSRTEKLYKTRQCMTTPRTSNYCAMIVSIYYLCLSAIKCNASHFATIENGETVQNKTMYDYLKDVQLLCYDCFIYYLCLSAIRCNASRFATIENGETVQNKTMYDYLEDVQLLCYDGFIPINGQDSIMCLSPSSFTGLFAPDLGCEGELCRVFITVEYTLDKEQSKTLIYYGRRLIKNR